MKFSKESIGVAIAILCMPYLELPMSGFVNRYFGASGSTILTWMALLSVLVVLLRLAIKVRFRGKILTRFSGIMGGFIAVMSQKMDNRQALLVLMFGIWAWFLSHDTVRTHTGGPVPRSKISLYRVPFLLSVAGASLYGWILKSEGALSVTTYRLTGFFAVLGAVGGMVLHLAFMEAQTQTGTAGKKR